MYMMSGKTVMSWKSSKALHATITGLCSGKLFRKFCNIIWISEAA